MALHFKHHKKDPPFLSKFAALQLSFQGSTWRYLPRSSPTWPIPCPYFDGAKLRLYITPADDDPYEVRVEVTKCFTPFTMSPAMIVTLESTPEERALAPLRLPNELVLKVYDRRFAGSLRKRERAEQPTYGSEASYRHFVKSGDAPDGITAIEERLDELYDNGATEDPPELLEHLFVAKMQGYFEAECAAYNHLKDLQGRSIPRLYCTITLNDPPASGLEVPVPGVLLELIPGTNLDKVDPSMIDPDPLIRSAMRIVEEYSDRGMLNKDVRLENFIVKRDGSGVVMIDWALSRMRDKDEGDEEWKRAKWGEDEEGAIGYHARDKFKWNYVPTHKYLVKADDDSQ